MLRGYLEIWCGAIGVSVLHDSAGFVTWRPLLPIKGTIPFTHPSLIGRDRWSCDHWIIAQHEIIARRHEEWVSTVFVLQCVMITLANQFMHWNNFQKSLIIEGWSFFPYPIQYSISMIFVQRRAGKYMKKMPGISTSLKSFLFQANAELEPCHNSGHKI